MRILVCKLYLRSSIFYTNPFESQHTVIIFSNYVGYCFQVGLCLTYPTSVEDKPLCNYLLGQFDRKCHMIHFGRQALFAAIFQEIIVPEHIRDTYLRGYMLNYISLEWDDMQVNILFCISTFMCHYFCCLLSFFFPFVQLISVGVD